MKKYIRGVLTCGFRIIFAYFLWIRKYAKHPEKYPIELRFAKAQKLCRLVLKHLHVVYDINGLDQYYKDKKEGKNNLIIMNHLSDADPLVLIAIAKHPITFVAKKETETFPFVGKIVKGLEGLFLDREDIRQQLKVMAKVEEKLVHFHNLDFVIFPEGTRNKNPMGDLNEFKHGTFRPAMKSGTGFSLFAVYGTQRVFDIKCKCNWNPVSIKYVKTYNSKDYAGKTTAEMALEAQNLIADNIKELRINDEILMNKLNKKH